MKEWNDVNDNRKYKTKLRSKMVAVQDCVDIPFFRKKV
jgi:hypothetical protein